MKKHLLKIFLFVTVFAVAQKNKTIGLGRTTIDELKMTVYEKDSTAKAVVLEEIGYTHFNTKGVNYYSKEYYVRIKILRKSGFSLATVEVPFYKKSRLKNIEAISYNLSDSGEVIKTVLEEKDIHKEKYSKNIRVSSFAVPNVKVGSVIEYKYTYTRNGYGIYDWNFQSDIPKIKTVYKAALSLRSNLQLRLIGFLKPSFESAELKKRCVGVYRCSALHYEMIDVPAFKEEKYLTSKKNYLSRLSFERKYQNAYVNKAKDNQWGALDKAFESTYKHRLNQSAFYRRMMPTYLFKEKDNYKKAIQVYKFIQRRFTKDYNLNNRFEDVYEKKTGTAGQINLALYNALIAAEINANLVAISTRKNGFVTKLHASLEDFNYKIVKVNIGGKDVFLDASEKNLSFGLLPFKTLNGDGRVLDFKKGSYWQKIVPTLKTKKNTKVTLSLNEDAINGDITIIRTGYSAKLKRDKIEAVNEDSYLEDFESKYPDLEVDTYSRHNQKNIEEPLKEAFNVSLELENNQVIKINPFLIGKLNVNPFKMKERKYPVDFGFKRSERYLFSLIVPEAYKIKQLPENIALRLPNKGGTIMLTTMQKNNMVTILYKFYLNKRIFHPIEYQSLKEFYNKVISTQDTFIELEKK